ncbi:MAG: helix-turn-helix transcriptional regulator [Oscillospiraceae bacterium]|nr:helix-turn-helix transcriptional regulator [Oscillospiraceae bacterium]
MKYDNIIVTRIHEPFTVHSHKGRYFQMNGRRYFGLSLCISGQITYTHNGVTYVSQPGNAVILPQGGEYTLCGDKAGLFPLINFHCTGLPTDRFLVLPLEDPHGCLAEFDAIRASFLAGGKQLEVFSLFYRLLHKVLQSQPADSRLTPVLRYIDTYYSDAGLTNQLLADHLGISEVYLRKLFLEELHITPKQYILEKRITEAKQLLRNTTVGVSQVGEQCGFSGVYHFCRAFKKRVGITPTQYAEQNRIFNL